MYKSIGEPAELLFEQSFWFQSLQRHALCQAQKTLHTVFKFIFFAIRGPS